MTVAGHFLRGMDIGRILWTLEDDCVINHLKYHHERITLAMHSNSKETFTCTLLHNAYISQENYCIGGFAYYISHNNATDA